MEKRWVLKDEGSEEIVNKLSEALSIDKVLSRLLVQRGVISFLEAKDFFRPSLDNLHDPFLMKDMDIAVQRIDKAVLHKERIMVYGDYDVDGTTAVALAYAFLRDFHENIDYYIPDRYKEGYGISKEGIEYAADTGVSLIIALDCGIKALGQVSFAKEKGIDFIICDHHRPGDTLPDAVAVLDPKRDDCNYPYIELSGCGIGFKLAQAYYQKNRMPFQDLEKFLDLVAVSIAADIVPITGENRILSYFGLQRLNFDPRPGFESILFYSNIIRKSYACDKTVFTREITINDAVFLIGPRINAAGRIESGKAAVELLLCERMGETHVLSQNINNNNTERRSLDTEITRQALEMIDSDPELQKTKSTVLYNPEWHKGVIGIVASRLTESYYRPTVVLTESNGVITGSARSVKDFDVYDAIDACSEYLDHFGGHKYAAGLSLKPENLDSFRNAFEQTVASTITDHMLVPEIEIDAELNLSQINPRFFRILKQFAPHGPENMSPVFITKGVVDRNSARIVGQKHLKLVISHPDEPGISFNAIAFQQASHFDAVNWGKYFDIVYQIEENEWNGTRSLQLNIKDIKTYLE
ncbi:MAG: single-stranded-DNA-specific exonuclease RecJ [Bacteroidetes bacterium]|nr:MAG: single-stranded-DNA-specific exonuclease RecJ [Bacteroidota bacterium]